MSAWSPESLLPDYIRQFAAYIPSKPDSELMRLYGVPRLLRLNNNENPLGPPLAAQEAIRTFDPKRAAVYPSGDAYFVRTKLAEKFGMHEDQFLAGNGANEVIAFVIKAFCEAGDNIITADKTFAVYEWVATFSGIEARLVPLRGFEFDDQEMLNQIDSRTKVIFICNPNNPTGSYWNLERLERFLNAAGENLIVVVDEAYAEFVEASDYPDGLSLIPKYPNLIVFRTFSKMYGLAGLRLGYLAGQLPAVGAIRKTCIVYSVNALAQEAAVAALSDTSHIVRTREMVKAGKAYLFESLERIGVKPTKGEGNFTMMKLPVSDSLVYRKLMKKGVMLRPMTSFRFPNFIRVTVSTLDVMEALVTALTEVLPERS